ncbi:TPA: SUF system NifU family Fe-S cluster assembly protein [Candidatus Woesearchaeota archaeon]|nr:SUF system NifU family Fe-S cluster assembly protein [Candidatus Woesearchaeota archaeon]
MKADPTVPEEGQSRPNASASEPDPLRSGALSDEQQLYKENILDHYKHPRNKRTMEAPTYSLAGKNPLCGDAITVSLRIEDEIVADIAFQGTGCAISQAAMSLLTERVKGMRAVDVLALGPDDIVSMLGIPIGPVRMKCAMLGLRTAQDALNSRRSM